MPRDCSLYQHQVLFRKHFHNFQIFHLNTVAAIPACHAHAFEYFGRKRGCANRTRSTQTVVLTVGLAANTAKAVSFDNPLKAFTFRDAYRMHFVAFIEYIAYREYVAQRFLDDVEIAEFYDFSLRAGLCFRKMADQRIGRIFCFGFAKTKLKRGVPVGIVSFDLSNHTRACFNYGAGYVTTSFIKNAGHTDFLTDYAIHRSRIFYTTTSMPAKVVYVGLDWLKWSARIMKITSISRIQLFQRIQQTTRLPGRIAMVNGFGLSGV